MPDLMFGGEDGTPLITAAPERDISSIITNYGQPSAFVPQKPDAGSISDLDIEKQMQIAIDAVGQVAMRSVPQYKSPDTAKYQDAVQRVRDVATGNAEDLATQRRDFSTASAQEKQAILAKGTATIEKNNADQARVQSIADIAYKAIHEMGVDGNANRISEKVGQFHALNDQYLTLEQTNQALKQSVAADAEKLRQESAVTFGDDPLRWIEGIFTIPQLNDTVDAGIKQIGVLDNKQATLKAAIDSIGTDINETVAAAKDSIELRNRTIPAITAQQAAAENNFAAATSTEKAAAADKDLAKQNSLFAGQKFAETVTAENSERAAAVLKQQEAELQWRSGVQAVGKAASDAEAKLKIVDMMTKMQDSQQIRGMLKLAEIRMGYPEGSLTYSRYKNLPDSQKEFVFGTAMGFTGATPGDAFFNWRDAASKGLQPGPGLPVQSQKMLEDTKAFIQQISSNPQIKLDMQGMNKDQQRQYLANKINERYANFQANPATDAEHNPYYEQSPQRVAQAVVAAGGNLGDTKIGKILQPFITGSSVPNTDMIIAALRDGAANTEEAAAMISQYYQLNTRVKNGAVDYAAFGLKPSDTYIYRAKLPGAVFGNNIAPVDLTNQTEVKNFLLRQQKATQIRNAVEEGKKNAASGMGGLQ